MILPDTWVLVGALLAGFVQGLSGFGTALVTSVFWSATLPPSVAAPLITISSVISLSVATRSVLPSLQWRLALPLLLGGIAGTPIGILVNPLIDPLQFRLGVGILLCVYCPAMLMVRHLPTIRGGGPALDALVGVVGGVMGGIAALSGPVPVLWCSLRGGDRHSQRATLQVFILTAQIAALIGYTASGLYTAPVLRLALWIVPCVLVPSILGTMLYSRLNAEAFRRIILVLLAFSGILLVGQSLPQLLWPLAPV